MATYKVKAKVPHLKVDGKILGPGDTFEQTKDYYERNKSFVEPIFPPQELKDPVKPAPSTNDDTEDEDKSGEDSKSSGRVVRRGKNQG